MGQDTYQRVPEKTKKFTCLSSSVVLLIVFIFSGHAFAQYSYTWKTDTTYEGADSVNMVQPVQVLFLDAPVQVRPNNSSLRLLRRYSVILGSEWDEYFAYRLLKTFESIPRQKTPRSLWQLTDQHIYGDIEITVQDDHKIVTVSTHAFTYSEPQIAQIEDVRGRFFSKRLHRAVVRFITNNGNNREIIDDIFKERYGIDLNVSDYTELTKNTTKEHAGRFGEFKNEELLALINMFGEYPSGLQSTPGLKHIVRRLDGQPHPINPQAPAIAWTNGGYIEFMESAFKDQDLGYIHRLILHEKAHFLWAYLFDDQLKQDWIELGGWYVNPEDVDGWSTTKQTEFVSAYAHAKNPNEDMAESIAYYIENPNKLRSRSPDKYEFIRDRIMHGTSYISRIRQDLTFQVYNLYPDVTFPGRIIRVDIKVEGGAEDDKEVTIELEIHRDYSFDSASASSFRVRSERGTYFDMWVYPVGDDGRIDTRRGATGYILRNTKTISKHAAHGYWWPNQITLRDPQGNERHESQVDFGWKLFINNPMSDDVKPQYVKNSMRLSLSNDEEDGRSFQIAAARWQVFEEVGIHQVLARLFDVSGETYSRRTDEYGAYNAETGEALVQLKIPDYYVSGDYGVVSIMMRDLAGNYGSTYFTDPGHGISARRDVIVDELPARIQVKTTNPDTIPLVIDLNAITVSAKPVRPINPNGETHVDIIFQVKDNISGYRRSGIRLRDPNGGEKNYWHSDDDYSRVYFTRDPTVYHTYNHTIILPVGSIPGTWGLAKMTLEDKARNILRVDFTEIIRFEVTDTPLISPDFDGDGQVAFEDFLAFVHAFGTQSGQENFDPKFDLDGNGEVGFSDFLIFVNSYGKPING